MLPLKKLKLSSSVFSQMKPIKSDEERKKNLRLSKTVYPVKPDEVYKSQVTTNVKKDIKKNNLRISKTSHPVSDISNYSEWHAHLNTQLTEIKGF